MQKTNEELLRRDYDKWLDPPDEPIKLRRGDCTMDKSDIEYIKKNLLKRLKALANRLTKSQPPNDISDATNAGKVMAYWTAIRLVENVIDHFENPPEETPDDDAPDCDIAEEYREAHGHWGGHSEKGR